MEKYKLLKDIIWAEAGTIFKLREVAFWNCVDLIEWKSIWTILDLATCLWIDNKEWFEEIKEVKSIYDLRRWDEYYFFDSDLNISSSTVIKPKAIAPYGWIFLTKEEAETELSKRKAMATIKKWSHDNDWGYEFKIDEECYEIVGTDDWLIYHKVRNYFTINNQYYSIKDKADNAILELEAEYKIVFNIK